MEKYIGQKVIVRGDRSGVFFGTLADKDGQEVELKKCRRICGFGLHEGDCASWTPPVRTRALRRLFHRVKLFLVRDDCAGNCLRCACAELCYYDFFDR